MNTKELLQYYRMYIQMIRMDADEDNGEQKNNQKHHGSGTRLPYGLCKAAGIEVPEGTTPSQAWALLEGKTGITAKDVYKHIKEKKTVKDTVKAIKEEKPEIKVPKSIGGLSSYDEKKQNLSKIKNSLIDSANTGYDSVSSQINELKPGIVISVSAWKGYTPTTYVKDDDGSWSRFSYGRRTKVEASRVAHSLEEGAKDTIQVRNKSVSAKDVADNGINSVEDFEEFRNTLVADAALYTDEERPYTYDDLDNAFKKGSVLRQYGNILVKTDDGWILSNYGDRMDSDRLFRSMESFRYDMEFQSEKKPIPENKDVDERKSKSLESDAEKTIRGLKVDDFIDLEIDGKTYRYTRVRGGISGGTWKGDIDGFSKFVNGLKDSGLLNAKVYTTKKPVLTAEEKAAKRAEEKARREAREKAKAELKKPHEPTGEIHERPSSLENYDEMMKPVRQSIMLTNGLHDEDVEFMENTLKTLFEKNDYLMRCDPDVIGKVLDSHFMNQKESKRTHGASWHGGGRESTSHKLFGNTGSHDEDPDYFEKYGYCDRFENSKSGYSGMASGYGDVVVKFRKDRVAERTTYTADDSLGPRVSEYAGRAGSKPTFEGLTYCYGVKRALKLMREKGADVTPRELSGCYMELQYHGRLSIEDVEEICIPYEPGYRSYSGKLASISEDDAKRLKERGIKIYVKDKGYI